MDPQAPETFRSARLLWAERTDGPHAAMLDWYRRLLAIRRSHPSRRPGPLPRDGDAAEVRDGVVSVRRGDLGIVADLRAHGAARTTVIPGEVLAGWGDVTHDGAATVTTPGSAIVVDAP
jgi:maltooligosyltrehalose trehalohydrolase